MGSGARDGWGGAALTGVLVLLLGAAHVARGDVPPPNLSQCDGKRVGTSCVTDNGKDGACQTSSCSRHSLAPPPPVVPSSDGGVTLTDTSPRFVFTEYACNVCMPKGEAVASVEAGAVPPDASASLSPPPVKPSSGCSVGRDASASGPVSPVFLLVAFFFLSARSRRARRAV
jgi:hypothetical protein